MRSISDGMLSREFSSISARKAIGAALTLPSVIVRTLKA